MTDTLLHGATLVNKYIANLCDSKQEEMPDVYRPPWGTPGIVKRLWVGSGLTRASRLFADDGLCHATHGEADLSCSTDKYVLTIGPSMGVRGIHPPCAPWYLVHKLSKRLAWFPPPLSVQGAHCKCSADGVRPNERLIESGSGGPLLSASGWGGGVWRAGRDTEY